MVCFFRKDRIFLPSPMVARNLSGSKSRLFVIVGRHTRLLAIILIQESWLINSPVYRGAAERPCRTFFRGTEQFCTVLQRFVCEAGNGSKEEFPASLFDGLPTLLEKDPLWAAAPRKQANNACILREIGRARTDLSSGRRGLQRP